MKKLITLLFCTALIGSAFAQRNDHNRHERDRRDNNYTVYQNNNSRYNERDRQIQRINAEYNFKINQVNNDWRLKRGQKKHAIKTLEKQRALAIRQANIRFNSYGYNKNNNGSYNRNYDNNHNSRHYNDRDDD